MSYDAIQECTKASQVCPLTFNNKIYRLFSRYLENWLQVMAVKEKGPIFERGTKSCCDGFRFVYKMRRQRTPPVFVCAFYVRGWRVCRPRSSWKLPSGLDAVPVGLFRLWWPVSKLTKEKSRMVRNLWWMRYVTEAFYFYWPATLYHKC